MEPTSSFSFTPLPNVVLQCGSCKTIIGDTQEFVCATTIAGTKIIAVRAATDVTVDRIAQKCTVNAQVFTYFNVCCTGCGGVVGRMYTQVPSEAQPLQNSFSFDVAKCSCYKFGSADLRVSDENSVPPPSTTTVTDHDDVDQLAGNNGGGGGGGGGTQELLLARVDALEAELLKMQGMILLHDGQLQGLPGYPMAATAAAT